MKYEVTYSCGHTGTVQLYGKQMKENGRFPIIKNTDSALSVRKKQKQKENEKMGFVLCSTVEYELSGKRLKKR